MDKNILAAIIGAIAAIIASLVGVLKRKKPKIPTPQLYIQVYILGSNIAKVGWAKAVPNLESHNVIVSTTALLDDLKFPKRLTHQFESFADKIESIDQRKYEVRGQISTFNNLCIRKARTYFSNREQNR